MRRLALGALIGGPIVLVASMSIASAAGLQTEPIGGAPVIDRVPKNQLIDDVVAAHRAKGLIDPAPKGMANPNPSDDGQIVLPDGGTSLGAGLLFEGESLGRPPIALDATFTSAWSTFGSDDNVDVWAGARASDPETGLVFIVHWNRDRTVITSMQELDSTDATGAFTIVDDAAGSLKLSTTDGGFKAVDVVTGVIK